MDAQQLRIAGTAAPALRRTADDRELGTASTRKPQRRPLVTVKDLLWLAYLYPLRLLAAALPAPAIRAVARLLVPFFDLTVRTKRQAVLERLTQAFGARRSTADLEGVARRFVANAVFRAMDDLALGRPIASEGLSCLEIRGLEHLESARAAGAGAILLTGHFYANRIAKRHLAELGYPTLSVRNREPPDASMGRLGRRLLQPQYVEFLRGVIAEEVFLQDPECSLKMLKRLRSGGLVNVHLDAPSSRRVVRLPFLGAVQPFPLGWMLIARLACCPIVPMLCLGNSRGFRIVFEQAVALGQNCTDDELVSIYMPKFVKTLESQILEHPDEWELWVRL